MTRHHALFLALAAAPLAQAGALPRSFTVTSFDRIRVEAPYQVTLATNRSPFARAEGTAAALDAVDLRVEGRTLILRQRRNAGSAGSGGPVRISLGTPELNSASLAGSGSLAIDRLRGLSAQVAIAGPGSLSVGEVAVDRLAGSVQGSGALRLGGRAKSASLAASGSASLSADLLQTDALTLTAQGSGEVSVSARTLARITAAGMVQVRVSGTPACELKLSGSASVEGCAAPRR